MKTLKVLKGALVLNAKNIPGWRSDRKIVVIEADDWGGIRMPSKEVYDLLLRSEIPLGQDRFTKFDTLASVEDLDMLFVALKCVKDQKGRAAVMTPFTSVANPDFKKIQASDFHHYHYERFTDTLEKQGLGTKVFQKWKEGMEAGLFIPESHGREHITVQLWMDHLLHGDQILHRAFEHGFVALDSKNTPPPALKYRPEFYFSQKNQIPFLQESLKDGVRLFRDVFGYTPRVFAPSNAIFHKKFEKTLAHSGVKYLNVAHRSPFPANNGHLKYRRYIDGSKSENGLRYYIRNCAFEPTAENYQGTELTLKQIAAAFRWRKPAIISTHRVNFVGRISPEHRETGLRELRKLLHEIVKRWPEVEFQSSADSLDYLSKQGKLL